MPPFLKLLILETTCDETAAAVVTDQLEVLSSVVASQVDLHRRYGGVVPELASRAHVERILPVIDEALRTAGVGLHELDAVAVANTPGLAGSLLVGLAAAKALCVARGLPLIALNHLQAHRAAAHHRRRSSGYHAAHPAATTMHGQCRDGRHRGRAAQGRIVRRTRLGRIPRPRAPRPRVTPRTRATVRQRY